MNFDERLRYLRNNNKIFSDFEQVVLQGEIKAMLKGLIRCLKDRGYLTDTHDTNGKIYPRILGVGFHLYLFVEAINLNVGENGIPDFAFFAEDKIFTALCPNEWDQQKKITFLRKFYEDLKPYVD